MTNYNRFDPADNFEAIQFRSDRVLQSAELNELQAMTRHRLQAITDRLYKDGDVMDAARIIVNQLTGETRLEGGAVYLAGAARGVPPAEMVISVDGTVVVGIYLREATVTELEDPSLLNPAVGTRGYKEPGASRLQLSPEWGILGGSGQFYPVYFVDDGVVRAKEPPPQLDAVTQALARYDRDSAGGTYVIDGLVVAMADDLPNGRQVYTVGEGRARVNGYGVELQTSRRVVYDAQPDLRHIANEPHISMTAGVQRINLDRAPAAAITKVTATAERTVNVTHGAFGGASDPLPDTSVLVLRDVRQGSTVYEIDVNVKLTGGVMDWSLPGPEPAPGSTYQVTYHHMVDLPATDGDADGLTVTGAVPGTVVLVDYDQMLPRIDRLALTPDAQLIWVRGIAADWSPLPAPLPSGVLGLAQVTQRWRPTGRQIANVGVRMVPMDSLAAVSGRIDRVWGLLAQERLRGDIHTREAGTKKGLFVDPFLDDSMRDVGVLQSGAIFTLAEGDEAGVLTLPIVDVVAAVPNSDVTAPTSMAFTLDAVISQTLRTDSMKVNPYMAFEPLPTPLVISPAVDHWNIRRTVWTSTQTQLLTAPRGQTVSSVVSTSVTGSTSGADAFLREIDITFEATNFGPGEVVTELSFDGIDVLPPGGLVANAQGVVAGSFRIPPSVPVGTKQVRIVGSVSRGWATFTGSGTTTIISATRVVQRRSAAIDPLAQTFTLPRAGQVAAVDLWFVAKGPTRVLVQVREVQLGLPTAVILAETSIDTADIKTDGTPTRVAFDGPIALAADTEYALVVLCDDPTSALAVGVLGQFDVAAQQWVTAQPYNVGVLLSSANASTWTPHQERDLAFRLLVCAFDPTTRTLDLGTVEVANATDLMLMALAEVPSSQARIGYTLSLPGGAAIEVAHGQPVRLAAPVTGHVRITAKLQGTRDASPLLYPDTQLLAGTLGTVGDYITRAVPAGLNSRVRLVYELLAPAGSSAVAQVSDGAANAALPGSWSALPVHSSAPADDGWVEMTHELTGVNHLSVRAKLVLSGTTAARPQARRLRLMVLEG